MPSLPRRATNLLTLCLLLALASIARAQPVFDELPTLEWRTAQADLVLAATIASVGESTDGWGVATATITLEPVETFKGNTPATLVVSMPNSRFRRSVAEGLTERMEAGDTDLWFLVAPDDTGRYTPIGERIFTAFLPLENPPTAAEPDAWLRRPLAPALTMDLVRYDGKDAVFDALRRVAREEPARAQANNSTPAHQLQLSQAFAASLWPENPNPSHPVAPADARLEALARRMIQRPASFQEPLPDTASQLDHQNRAHQEASVRREGARALAQHFESEENARLLATLLADTSVGTLQPRGLAEPARHAYITRMIAFEALTTWGVDVPGVELEATINDASLAPSPAAVGEAHGPRGNWYDVSEFFIELNGDSNPELLRLYLVKDKYGDTAYDLERFRTKGAMCWAFSLFAFHEGEPVMVFHRGNSLEGFALSLREHDRRPMLFTKQPQEWTTRSAYGWWPMWGSIEHAHWSARTGNWDDQARTFEPTGDAPLVRFDHSK